VYNSAASVVPELICPAPAALSALLVSHLFQTGWGRECLASHGRELCRVLWRQWSPTWRFDEAAFERTAVSFDDTDFVDVVIHAYRHAFGAPARASERAVSRPMPDDAPVTIARTLVRSKPATTSSAVLALSKRVVMRGACAGIEAS